MLGKIYLIHSILANIVQLGKRLFFGDRCGLLFRRGTAICIQRKKKKSLVLQAEAKSAKLVEL